jgi:hypothetical protein
MNPIKTIPTQDAPVKPRFTNHDDSFLLRDRHRLYGAQCPALDIDCLMIETDFFKTQAIIEYKRYPYFVNVKSVQCRTIKQLAADLKVEIPAAVVVYNPANNFDVFVVPLNQLAKEAFETYCKPGRWMPERHYVQYLYRIRGKECSEDILRKLVETPAEQTSANRASMITEYTAAAPKKRGRPRKTEVQGTEDLAREALRSLTA